MALQLSSKSVRQEALNRAANVSAHLAGVASITGAGAVLIDRMMETKRSKLVAAALVGGTGFGVSIYGHIKRDRLIETVGDGVFGAGLLTLAFHAYPKIFAQKG